MTQALLVSNAVLWMVVVLLGCVVAALARQIGVLHERVAPAGALMVGKGPAVGEPAPFVRALDLTGTVRDLGGPGAEGRSTLLFFLSPTCPVCKTLLPVLRQVARRERDWLGIVLASDGARDEHEAFVRAERLESFPYVLSPALGITYQVGKLPYAVLLDAAGVVRARGLVNTREHLDSLCERATRALARRTSRRSFLTRLGTALAGTAALPLLPMARAATESRPPVPDDAALHGEVGDPKSCSYWRHCAIDGFLCSCCGGSQNACPPGTEMSPLTWIGTCRNPGDGKDYIISYNDCCGQSLCLRCRCTRTEGEKPLYFT